MLIGILSLAGDFLSYTIITLNIGMIRAAQSVETEYIIWSVSRPFAADLSVRLI